MKTILELSPYYMNLYIEITHDISTRIGQLTKNTITSNGHCCCCDFDGNEPDLGEYDYLMLIHPSSTPGDISHEVLHIINMLFRDKNIKWLYSNDEPAAYLMGWLVEQINNLLNQHKDICQ